jgi:hypothetical protein
MEFYLKRELSMHTTLIILILTITFILSNS